LKFLEHESYMLITLDPTEILRAADEMCAKGAANREYLAEAGPAPRGGRLTGTFIYAHPPDYVGRPTLNWKKDEWRSLFGWLKELRIDTAIFQAAAWAEIRECYYPSKVFSGFRGWNILDPLTEAAAAEGMTLFLGGLGNLLAFDERTETDDFSADRDRQLACVRELWALYRGGFQGFYMSPETGFPGRRDPAREEKLNAYYGAVCRGAKELMPDLPILFSPATYYQADCEAEIRGFLTAIFRGCPVDILCPQDSIGVFGNRLADLPASFGVWREICREVGAELWVNAESFERVRAGTTQDFEPADFRRLAFQLANAGKFGKKIVSWEVPYFYSALAGERGDRLRREYLASLVAGERD
jgi:hypothetical protein